MSFTRLKDSNLSFAFLVLFFLSFFLVGFSRPHFPLQSGLFHRFCEVFVDLYVEDYFCGGLLF